MSSKATIFLTTQNEHCYVETLSGEDGKGYDVYLEIAECDILEVDRDFEGILIGIKGGSPIARALQAVDCNQIKDVLV